MITSVITRSLRLIYLHLLCQQNNITKWSDIERYRRVIPEAAYITLRHYETIVVIDSHSGKKDHRILSLSEDRFYILEHKKYHQECPLPVLLKDIIRIDLLKWQTFKAYSGFSG